MDIAKEVSVQSKKKGDFFKEKKRKEAISGYLLIAPYLILMFIFTIIVFSMGAMMSMSDAQFINEGKFIGLQNYVDVLTQKDFWRNDFWKAVRITFLYMLGCLVTQIPAAFILAYILNNVPRKMMGVLRASFFIPVLINSIIVALIFRMLFNPDHGIINWVLGVFGLPNDINWLSDSTLVIPILIIVSFWQWVGFHTVYFLAYLQTINKSIYEAARIDGASQTSVLLKIILPMMRPAFTFVMVTAAIGGLMMFDYVYMVYPNATYGPGGVAKTLVAYIYDEAFAQDFKTGFASAIGWCTFFIIMAFSMLQLKVLGLGKKNNE
jgi:ABC-type sugar transport system permease subunit